MSSDPANPASSKPHHQSNVIKQVRESESGTAWPVDLHQATYYGTPPSTNPLLKLTSLIARRARSDISWSYFFKDEDSEKNSVSNFPSMVQTLENIFQEELFAPFAREHLEQLSSSDILIVVRHRKSNKIVGYSCARIEAEPGDTSSQPVVYGGIVVIQQEFQRSSIGILMAAQLLSLNRRVVDLFADLYFIARTNNKHMLGPMKACGDVFRSDQLGNDNLPEVNRVRRLITHMHQNIFEVDEPLLWTKPIHVNHYFDEKVRIDGVGGNEIIYAVCRTSLIRATMKLVLRSRSKRRSK